MSARTPGPWVLVESDGGNFDRITEPLHGRTIATINGDPANYKPTEQERADGLFIVEACNAYDGLRAENERLREALTAIDSDITTPDAADRMVLIARSALAVKGGQ